MELGKKFKDASLCQLLRVDQMILNREYTIMRAVRLSGCIFFLRDIREYVSHLYKIYLTIQYADVVSEKDIDQINNNKVWVSLVYTGLGKDVTAILEVT
jgi:hypothetical protein